MYVMPEWRIGWRNTASLQFFPGRGENCYSMFGRRIPCRGCPLPEKRPDVALRELGENFFELHLFPYQEGMLHLFKEITIAFRERLTGLLNESALLYHLNHQVKRVKRGFGTFSLVFLDIDKFKKINDIYGRHEGGDAALKFVAASLKTFFRRDADVVARKHGDEFIVVLPNVDHATAVASVNKFLKIFLVKNNFSFQGGKIPLSLSAGVAECSPNCSSEQILALADEALYISKARGRNCVT